MKKNLKYIVLAASAILAIVFGSSQALAMASQFMASTYGAGSTTGTSATTTYSWITPGTGTTTVTMTAPTSLTTKYDKAFVGFEVTATSTANNSKLNARVESSWDGIDWYQNTVASSSVAVTGVMQQEMSFNIATSTAYINNGTTTRIHSGFFVETPTPYTRVVFYSPIGGPSLSLHVRAQPIKEVQLTNQ